METKFLVTNGDLYLNGVCTELRLVGIPEIRIQAVGTGSCKIVGKLMPECEFTPLATVRLSDFAVCESITDTKIHALDVSGLYSIAVQEVEGFEKVWAKTLV